MEKKREVFFILVLVTVVVIIYQHTLKYDLIWDTQTFIKESFLLKNDVSPLSAFKYGYIYGQLGMDTDLLKNELYYRLGNSAYPQKWVEKVFRQYPGDFQIRNRQSWAGMYYKKNILIGVCGIHG